MKMEEARDIESLRNKKRRCNTIGQFFTWLLDSVLNTDYVLSSSHLNLLYTAHRNILTALILKCIYLMCVCKMFDR